MALSLCAMKLFMRESHVLGIKFSTHILSKELLKRVTWRFMKYVFYHSIMYERFYHLAMKFVTVHANSTQALMRDSNKTHVWPIVSNPKECQVQSELCHVCTWYNSTQT